MGNRTAQLCVTRNDVRRIRYSKVGGERRTFTGEATEGTADFWTPHIVNL